jgi:hypothetical protein
MRTETDAERCGSIRWMWRKEHQISRPLRAGAFEFQVQEKCGFSAASFLPITLNVAATSKEPAQSGLFNFRETALQIVAASHVTLQSHPDSSGIGIWQSSCQRCNSEIIRLSRRIYKTGGDHPSRVMACRFRASGLNLGILTSGVGGAFG